MHLPFLYLRPSPLGGRGVFTSEGIPAGSVVELAPVIVLSAAERGCIHQTHLHDYYFVWGGEGAAIALGYGSLYNHGKPPNLHFACDYAFGQITFTAARPIRAGEELLIDYTEGEEREGLWFAVKES
jgi:SET domain-containing protein